MAEMKKQYRFIARVVIETKTPLNIGSGNKSVKTDSLVLRDVNGLPFIPGTTIAGLLRHSLDKEEQELLMGSQEKGSRLMITEARMLNEDETVLDGMIEEKDLKTDFLSHFRKQMTIRQHVKIDHRGTAVKHGKFDEEIIIKGTCFCFEIEMISSAKDDEHLKVDKDRFTNLLNHLVSPVFRIGSGSRSGFGEIEVKSCKYKVLDLNKDRQLYLDKSSSLNSNFFDSVEEYQLNRKAEGWTCYTLSIEPEDFLLFGSGFGDENGWADMTYVREDYIDWKDSTERIKHRDKVLLIPGSSVKGAISHRAAYYYNKGKEIFVDNLPEGKTINDFVGTNNPAVVALFGSEGVKVEGKMEGKQRGNVLISDVIEAKDLSAKYLNHVSIDRFTGGAIDGALFTEEVLYAKGQVIPIKLFVNKKAFDDVKNEEGEVVRKGKEVENAFEHTLDDICSGLLPLGGGVNRGNGCFKGSWTKVELK